MENDPLFTSYGVHQQAPPPLDDVVSHAPRRPRPDRDDPAPNPGMYIAGSLTPRIGGELSTRSPDPDPEVDLAAENRRFELGPAGSTPLR